MLFIAIGQLQSSAGSLDAVRQKLRSTPPPGVALIAEYWTQNASARVVLVFSAGSFSAMDDVVREWEDVVQFTISPAIVVRQALDGVRSAEGSADARRPCPSFERADGDDLNLPSAPQMSIRVTPSAAISANGQAGVGKPHEFKGVHAHSHETSLQGRLLTAQAPDSVPDDDRGAVGSFGCLTRREQEILDLLKGGRSNNQIADELFISVRTVERHVANMYPKLGVRSRAEAIAWSYRQQLLVRSA